MSIEARLACGMAWMHRQRVSVEAHGIRSMRHEAQTDGVKGKPTVHAA